MQTVGQWPSKRKRKKKQGKLKPKINTKGKKIENEDTEIENVKPTKKDQPLTALQASESRLVTKIRFEIERVNGRLKQFYALD